MWVKMLMVNFISGIMNFKFSLIVISKISKKGKVLFSNSLVKSLVGLILFNLFVILGSHSVDIRAIYLFNENS